MKKGFTLIELLAVIVILAIIALIATPIVLSIINDSKKSATLRSADFYMDALEYSITNQTLKGTPIEDGTYKINEGDICIDSQCTQKIGVQVNGEKPTSGEIILQNGQIDNVTLVIGDKTITKDENGQLVHLELKYTVGQEVTFNPGDGNKAWNVIDEGATTVTLMLTENLGNTVAWYAYENHNSYDNSYGPKDALDYLNSLTTNWTNVDPIKNYSYINNLNGTTVPNGYQKIKIKDGKTKLTHKDGTTITEVSGISKARILTLDEIIEIASKTNTNLTEENLRLFIERNLSTANAGLGTNLKSVDEGIAFATQLEGSEWMQYLSKYMQTYYTVLGMITKYGIETTYDISLPNYLYQNLYDNKAPYGYWTLSSLADGSDIAWDVDYDGRVNFHTVDDDDSIGVRPVITISKSKL